jgi:hypothetical protein
MTGAGGIIHANFMYQAKPDGLIIGNNAGGLILQQIMGLSSGADTSELDLPALQCKVN